MPCVYDPAHRLKDYAEQWSKPSMSSKEIKGPGKPMRSPILKAARLFAINEMKPFIVERLARFQPREDLSHHFEKRRAIHKQYFPDEPELQRDKWEAEYPAHFKSVRLNQVGMIAIMLEKAGRQYEQTISLFDTYRFLGVEDHCEATVSNINTTLFDLYIAVNTKFQAWLAENGANCYGRIDTTRKVVQKFCDLDWQSAHIDISRETVSLDDGTQISNVEVEYVAPVGKKATSPAQHFEFMIEEIFDASEIVKLSADALIRQVDEKLKHGVSVDIERFAPILTKRRPPTISISANTARKARNALIERKKTELNQ